MADQAQHDLAQPRVGGGGEPRQHLGGDVVFGFGARRDVLPFWHLRPPSLRYRDHLAAAGAAARGANRRSISRRTRIAAFSAAATSDQRTTWPAGTSRTSLTPCANPIGTAPSARLCAAGTSLPHTVYPPSPSRLSPARSARFATATTSPAKSLVWPVGSPRKAADSTEMPSSSPIR